MTIPTLGRNTSRFNGSLPAISFRVKNSQVIVVFLTVIPSENVKFVFEKCCRVIFYLGSLYYWAIIILLVTVNALIRPQRIQESSEASLFWLLLPIALAHQNPLELLGYLFASKGKVVRRIVRMGLVRHADVLLALLLRLVVIWMRDNVHSVVDHSSLRLLLLRWGDDLAHVWHVRDWPVSSSWGGVWFFVISLLTTFAVIHIQLVLALVGFSLHNN